jgi:hypothetical protein
LDKYKFAKDHYLFPVLPGYAFQTHFPPSFARLNNFPQSKNVLKDRQGWHLWKAAFTIARACKRKKDKD